LLGLPLLLLLGLLLPLAVAACATTGFLYASSATSSAQQVKRSVLSRCFDRTRCVWSSVQPRNLRSCCLHNPPPHQHIYILASLSKGPTATVDSSNSRPPPRQVAPRVAAGAAG
jgi:hypothetical protein